MVATYINPTTLKLRDPQSTSSIYKVNSISASTPKTDTMTTPTYSHDETIAAITKYYTFLTTLPYIPSHALHHAPKSGWETLNTTALQARGRSSKVLALLRHLPYLEHEDAAGGWTIAEGYVAIQYQRGNLYSDATEDMRDLPGHVIPLAEMSDREGTCLLLDTQTGQLELQLAFWMRIRGVEVTD